MDPITALILGGFGASVAGTGMGVGFLGQSVSNEFSAREARRQRRWMERMSNTQHQRQVEDMRKAGLNPILSATGGSGASVGTPASPSSAPANLGSVFDALNSVIGLYSAAKQASKLDAEVDKTNAETAQVKMATIGQAINNNLEQATFNARVTQAESEAAYKRGNIGMGKALADKAIAEAKTAMVRSDFDSSARGMYYYRGKHHREAFGFTSLPEMGSQMLNAADQKAYEVWRRVVPYSSKFSKFFMNKANNSPGAVLGDYFGKWFRKKFIEKK